MLIFLCFFLIIFGLFGVSFFQGMLRHTCHSWSAEEGWQSNGMHCDTECTWDEDTMELDGRCGSLGNGTHQNTNFAIAFRWSYSCRPGEECRCSLDGSDSPACTSLDNPNYGINSFDSLPWAMITLFQSITLEGWVDVMYALMDGCSVFAAFYMVPIVLFGGLILINLFLAALVLKVRPRHPSSPLWRTGCLPRLLPPLPPRAPSPPPPRSFMTLIRASLMRRSASPICRA